MPYIIILEHCHIVVMAATFADGFVSNVWLHDCAMDSPGVYVREFVRHSVSTDLPLETFVALDGDSGDVYSAQCNCISGWVVAQGCDQSD